METINWKNHLVELVVVIIGISIAFSLNNWAQANKSRQEEQDYITSIIIDLDDDIQQMQDIIDSSEILRTRSMELFQYLYGHPDPLSAITHEHMTAYYRVSYFQPNQSTYSALINSGELDLIRNFELRSNISALYTDHYEEVSGADAFVHKLVDDNLYPYIIENVKFSRTGVEELAPLKTTHFTNLSGSFYNMLNTRSTIYRENIVRAQALKDELKSYSRR